MYKYPVSATRRGGKNVEPGNLVPAGNGKTRGKPKGKRGRKKNEEKKKRRGKKGEKNEDRVKLVMLSRRAWNQV